MFCVGLRTASSISWECYTVYMIKVAVIWFVNEDGKLLLTRRADHKKQDRGVWGPTVTGKLERGETFDNALLREVEEEIALSPKNYTPQFLFEFEYAHPDGEHRLFGVYWANVQKTIENDIHLDPNEVAESQWVTIEEAQDMLTHMPEKLVPSAKSVWPSTFKKLGETI
jgi:isopentenyl-diphosphate delta-isomerase